MKLDETVVVETLEGEQTFTCEYHGDDYVLQSYPIWTYKGKSVFQNVVKVSTFYFNLLFTIKLCIANNYFMSIES